MQAYIQDHEKNITMFLAKKMLITIIIWIFSKGLCIYLGILSIFWTQ